MGAAPVKQKQPQNVVWFPTRSDLPETCTHEYILKTRLSSGFFSTVYEACKDNDCSYVAKVEPLVGEITPERFQEEVQLTQLMGERGVGPIMRSAWTCQWTTMGGPYDLGLIVMDKAYITFQNYVNAQRLISNQPNLSQIKFLLWKKIEIMLSLGYLHTDIHSNNVMFNLENNGDIRDLFLIDWNRVRQVPIYTGDNLVYFTTDVTNAAWERLLSGR